MVYQGQLRRWNNYGYDISRATLTVLDTEVFNGNTYVLVKEEYSEELSTTYTQSLEDLLTNTYPLIDMEDELGKL